MEQFWKQAQKSTILTTYFQTWFPSAVRRLDTFNDQNPLRKRCRRPAKVLLTGFSKIQYFVLGPDFEVPQTGILKHVPKEQKRDIDTQFSPVDCKSPDTNRQTQGESI